MTQYQNGTIICSTGRTRRNEHPHVLTHSPGTSSVQYAATQVSINMLDSKAENPKTSASSSACQRKQKTPARENGRGVLRNVNVVKTNEAGKYVARL